MQKKVRSSGRLSRVCIVRRWDEVRSPSCWMRGFVVSGVYSRTRAESPQSKRDDRSTGQRGNIIILSSHHLALQSTMMTHSCIFDSPSENEAHYPSHHVRCRPLRHSKQKIAAEAGGVPAADQATRWLSPPSEYWKAKTGQTGMLFWRQTRQVSG